MDAADYVLGRFREEERTDIEIAVQKAADAIESIIRQGVDLTMNTVNAAEKPA